MRPFLTFREEIARDHWAFSRLSKRLGPDMRKRIYSAVPIQLDEAMSKTFWVDAIWLHKGNSAVENVPVTRERLFTARMPEQYAELLDWRMPSSLVWAETQKITDLGEGQKFDGLQVGLLCWSHPKHFSPVPEDVRDIPRHLMCQRGQGLLFTRLPESGRLVTLFFVYANGRDAMQTLTTTDIQNETYPVLLYAAQVKSFEDIAKCSEKFSRMDIDDLENLQYIRMGRDMASEMLYPFLKIFNATPIKAVIRHHKGYRFTDEFAGTGFQWLGNKNVRLDMSRTIVLSFDEETVISSGRRKAQEFVRGYWRTRKKGILLPRHEWKWVDAFERGDPSLGMSKRSYEYVQSEADKLKGLAGRGQ